MPPPVAVTGSVSKGRAGLAFAAPSEACTSVTTRRAKLTWQAVASVIVNLSQSVGLRTVATY